MTTNSPPRPVATRTLEVPGAVLTYDVRGGPASAQPSAPALLLVGTPMAADGFSTLAGHFEDRPVVTYDPRNVGRSRCTTEATPTPEDHAADLHAIVEALRPELGPGRVDLFGSSGGAINALALAQAHPEDLRVVVAHEPPSAPVLPDAEVLVAACHAVLETYNRAGSGHGMAKFIALVSAPGEVGPEYLSRPDPDPAAFGMSAEDDGQRNDPLMQNMATIPVWGPDIAALQAVDCRVVLAYGEESGEILAARAPRAIAEQLGVDPVVFPGDHVGFLGHEFGQSGKPAEFAATLRRALEAG